MGSFSLRFSPCMGSFYNWRGVFTTFFLNVGGGVWVSPSPTPHENFTRHHATRTIILKYRYEIKIMKDDIKLNDRFTLKPWSITCTLKIYIALAY